MGDQRTDEELLVAAKDGDEAAVEVLFRRYLPAVMRFFVNKVDQAEDLAQETFRAAHEGIHRFEGRSSFRAYLLGIAKNILYNFYRKKKRRGEHEDLEELSVEDMRQTPSRRFGAHEQYRLLIEALRRLPSKIQIVIELRYWEDVRPKEIALMLNIPVGTVRTRIRRGKELLAQSSEHFGVTLERLSQASIDFEVWANDVRRRSLS